MPKKKIIKKQHLPLQCKYCKDIMTVFLIEKRGLRFLELFNLCKKLIDSKMSHTTLLRHLEPLQHSNMISKSIEGKQKVVYYLSRETFSSMAFSKEELEPLLLETSSKIELFRSLKLEFLLGWLVEFELLSQLHTQKLILENLCSNKSPEIASFQLEISKQIMSSLELPALEAMKGRTKQEYEEALAHHKEQIVNAKKTFGLIEEVNGELKELTNQEINDRLIKGGINPANLRHF
jgi:DNA-binding transcriptional ArsR family regulator